MSKILVTGGAGFIGSTLVDRLVAAGEEVMVLDDLTSGRESYLNPAAAFLRLSINDPGLSEIFAREKFDFVYHLAAQIDVRVSMERPAEDNATNLLGGLNVLEACRHHGVKKIIFSSTGGAVYGDTEELPTTESVSPYPLSFYGIHKLAFEKYLHCYWRAHGLDYAILRFANVYGPRQYKGGEAGVIAIFVANAVRNRPSLQFGDGRQTRDFVYVDDVVSGLQRAKDVVCRGEINIGTGVESSLLDVRRALAAALGREPEVLEQPAKPGEQRRSCLSPARAQAVLGWRPEVDLPEGIRRTIAWAQGEEQL